MPFGGNADERRIKITRMIGGENHAPGVIRDVLGTKGLKSKKKLILNRKNDFCEPIKRHDRLSIIINRHGKQPGEFYQLPLGLSTRLCRSAGHLWPVEAGLRTGSYRSYPAFSGLPKLWQA